jgi:DNA-binding CsgD family transcriptional regulator/PAS domain-containing protein
MLTQTDQERLLDEALRASYEATMLTDLGSQVLPILERMFDTSASVLYWCYERGREAFVAGTPLEMHHEYVEHYALSDPMQGVARRLNPWILHASRLPEWGSYLKAPVYTELMGPLEAHYFIHLRLVDVGHQEPGMVGMLLFRSARQPDFNERDEFMLARTLPALETLVRRSETVEHRLRLQPIVEAMLHSDPQPKIALDARGTLLWASESAERLMGWHDGGRKGLPEVLIEAARRLGVLTCPSGRRAEKKTASVFPVASIAIPGKGTAPVRAELRLARTHTGASFIIAELEDSGISPLLKEIAAQFQLTAAETRVLSLISLGLSDREITQRLFVSIPTVHSHVGRIFDKLGVHSRVQAALLAHGLKFKAAFEDEPSRDPPRSPTPYRKRK